VADVDARDVEDVERALAGDPDAYRGLLARHGKRVHDVARRMLRDAGHAEDITQQAFLNAWKALERFDTARPFRHWILRITTNLCRNHLASRKVRHRLLGARGGDDDVPDIQAAPEVPDPLEATAALDPRLRRAIEDLPPHHRLAVVLRYLHGLSIEGVSEVTGLPQNTIKTHLHRGRATLRKLLEMPETGDDAPGTT
jgi:RNA polymerase sigma-70 factor (ECF subfamily)